MAVKSIRVLVEFVFTSSTIRMWDGAGPYMDAVGNIWAGAVLNEGLDQIESAINGEAVTMQMALSGVDQQISDLAYEELESGDVIGAKVRLLIQDCDEWDQPVGDPQVRLTGNIDNMIIDDTVVGDAVQSTIVVEVTNRFNLRTLVNGAVLSDVDQRARSAILNPSAPADEFAERIPGLSDKTIRWPRYT